MTNTDNMQSLIDAFIKTDLPNRCEDIQTALGYYDGEPDADDFIEWYTEEYVNSAEIIYYYNAMKYLSEQDNSLHESMALAGEYGYQCENLNSELLATILLQQNLREELDGLRGELETYFQDH